MVWRNWLSALLGVWFLIAPWTLGITHEQDATWLSVFFGGVQVLVSIWAAVTFGRPSWRIWQNWIALIVGIWFLVHPFLGRFEVGQYWGIVAPAMLTIIINLWNLMARPTESDGRQDSDGRPNHRRNQRHGRSKAGN